jgi:deazaflavin-dependent oxidoreductase (nitroreductase family)
MVEVARRGGGNLEYNTEMVREFRANKGMVRGNGLEDIPLLILTTVGARSLRPRMRPAGYAYVNGNYLLAASLGGSPRSPDWHYNLLAHPHAIIEVGEDTLAVKSRLAVGQEREALFEIVCETIPIMREYQAMTSRVLPVHVLEVIGPEFGPVPVASAQATSAAT